MSNDIKRRSFVGGIVAAFGWFSFAKTKPADAAPIEPAIDPIQFALDGRRRPVKGSNITVKELRSIVDRLTSMIGQGQWKRGTTNWRGIPETEVLASVSLDGLCEILNELKDAAKRPKVKRVADPNSPHELKKRIDDLIHGSAEVAEGQSYPQGKV